MLRRKFFKFANPGDYQVRPGQGQFFWIVGIFALLDQHRGDPILKILNTAGQPDLKAPSGITIGSPRTQTMALYPALNEEGTQFAYFKVTGADASNLDLKSLKGALVVAQLKNGQLDEKEILKANVQGLAWAD